MAQENTNFKEKTQLRVKEPGQYNVVFHNDDFTPMEFVTFILQNIFFKNDIEAEILMLKVHHEGKAIVGTYTFDIAYSKANEATNYARNNGYPLRIMVNPV